MTAMNVSSRNKLSADDSRANGPRPPMVPMVAYSAASEDDTAAPCIPKRSAAQKMKGKGR